MLKVDAITPVGECENALDHGREVIAEFAVPDGGAAPDTVGGVHLRAGRAPFGVAGRAPHA